MATKQFSIEIEWRDVVGYEGLYKVSAEGDIKSIRSNKILSPDTNQDGYKRVSLYKNKASKHYSVHRLVAQAFIPNPDNLPQVNHIDEDKSNNCVSNLEWITPKDNCNYGTRNRKVALSKNKPVLQLSLEGDLIREWESASEVQRVLGYSQGDICNCCNNKLKTAHKFKWSYK